MVERCGSSAMKTMFGPMTTVTEAALVVLRPPGTTHVISEFIDELLYGPAPRGGLRILHVSHDVARHTAVHILWNGDHHSGAFGAFDLRGHCVPKMGRELLLRNSDPFGAPFYLSRFFFAPNE